MARKLRESAPLQTAMSQSSVSDYGKRGTVFGSLVGLLFFSLLAGVLVASLAAPSILTASRGASATIGFFDNLPDYLTIDAQTQRNLIFAQRDGSAVPIATIYDQDRQSVAWENVSKFITDAAVAGEDRRFWQHGGIDLKAIARAAAGNLVHKSITSGSSTIAMQLVKNILIQRALRIDDTAKKKAAYAAAIDDTLNRKLREMKFAIGLEKRYVKKDILLGYLNIAGFGGNTYGIESAAQKYFSVSARDVTLPQAASLIAMVQQPNARNLSDPALYAANKERRDLILFDMHDLGYIDVAAYQAAVATPIAPKLRTPNNGCLYAVDAKFACDFALRLVPTLAALGATEAARAAAWAHGGYSIYTSIDLGQQDVAQDNLNASAPPDETRFALGAAAVAMQPGTGRIVVMAQNKAFNNSKDGGGPTTTAVDYMTDKAYGGSSGFQVGSTYKIFTLTEWLKKGHTLSEVVDGTARAFNLSTFNSRCVNSDGQAPYVFHNDSPGEGGMMTVATATKNSVNLAFITMAQKLDVCDIRDTAKSYGVHRADGKELGAQPAAIIGTNEIAPLTMAAAIATVGANGLYCAPTIIDKVVGPDGRDAPGQPHTCTQSVAPNVAATVAYALTAVMTSGTGTPGLPRDGVPIVGKTGTTDDSAQNWLVATTTKMSLAVWVGNTDGGHRSLRKTTIAGTNGYSTKFNIFRNTMTSLNANPDYRGGAFPAPDPALVSGRGSAG
jgi:membrane peptidoglycan carboxypeptidase